MSADVDVDVNIDLKGNVRQGLNGVKQQLGSVNNELSDMEKLGRVMSFSALSQSLGSLSQQFSGIADELKRPYIEFEQQMINVKARITGISDQSYEELSALTKELGATTRFTATEIGQGMNKLVMAGFKPEQIKASMADITKFVMANNINFEVGADIATDIGTAFGYEADELDEVLDVLTFAASNANTDITMLGETMKYTAADANSLGLSLQETSTMAAILGNAGIKGSMAGTTIKEMVKALAVQDGAAQKAMKELEINVYDKAGNMRDLRSLIHDVVTSTKDLSEKERAEKINAIFKERGSRGILTIMGQGEEAFNNFLDLLQNEAAGTVERIAKTMSESMAAGLKGINSRKEALFTTITEAGRAQLVGLNQIKMGLLDGLNQAAKDNSVLAGRISLGIQLLGDVGSFVSQSGAVVSSIMSGIAAISMLKTSRAQSNALKDAVSGATRANPIPVWVMNAGAAGARGAMSGGSAPVLATTAKKGGKFAKFSGLSKLSKLGRLGRGAFGGVGGIAFSSIPMFLEMASISASAKTASEQKEAMKYTFSRNAWGMFGGAAGAAIGTILLPGIGTAIGGALGGLAGDMVSGKIEANKDYQGSYEQHLWEQEKDWNKRNWLAQRGPYEYRDDDGKIQTDFDWDMLGPAFYRTITLEDIYGAVESPDAEAVGQFEKAMEKLIGLEIQNPAMLAKEIPKIWGKMEKNENLAKAFQPVLEIKRDDEGNELKILHDPIIEMALKANPDFQPSKGLMKMLETTDDPQKYLADFFNEMSKSQFEQKQKDQEQEKEEIRKQSNLLVRVAEEQATNEQMERLLTSINVLGQRIK